MLRDLIRLRLGGLLSAEAGVSANEHRNTYYLCVEVFWWGIAFGTYLSYLSVFAARLGASNFWIGVLSSGPALVSIFWLVPAGRLVERQQRQMPILNVSLVAARLFIFLMLLTPWLAPAHPGEALAIMVVLQSFPTGVLNVAFTSVLADAISLPQLGRVVSQRTALVWLASSLGTLVSLPILAWLPLPTNYQIVLAIGFVAAMVSAYYVSRVQVPDRPPQLPETPRRRAALSWAALHSAWLEHPQYSGYVLAAFIYHAGLYIAVPLFPIYWVRVLNLSDAWIALVTVAFGLASVAASLISAPLIRRWGNNRLLVYSAVGMGFYPVATALAKSPLDLVWVVLLGGFFYGPLSISLVNRLIEVAPAAHRARYIGLYNAVINVAIFALPLASTALIPFWGIERLLFAAGAVRMGGGLLFLLSRGDVASTSQSVEQ
ncbi:MAG: MFS transporter [Chloroflexi bacterium]|nr:MFS transporter [Chloroflexota bacterium]